MKKKTSPVLLTLVITFCMASQVQAIGISPARWTADLLEYNCTFNSNIGYTLTRPSSRRYSIFSVSDAAGMTGTVTEFSASGGVEYQNDKSILIDWQSEELMSLNSITASINIQSPTSWDCPAEPGGGRYLADLVCHSEAFESDSGIVAGVATISQIAFYRNYAPRTYLQSSATTRLSVNLSLQIEDKHEIWWANNPEFAWFSYEIDWDNDGIIDQSGNATLDEEAVFQNNLYRWTSGIQISTLDLEHVYETGGNYTAMISVTDLGYVSGETTTFQIPVNVIPEPATIALLGLGGILLRKRNM